MYAAREWLRGPLLIQFGDTIPALDLSGLIAQPAAAIGVTEVRDPSGYGIVDVDAEGRARRLWEKPAHPPSNLAVAGTFYFPDAAPLGEALDDMIRTGASRDGEFWLTDAVQAVIERGGAVRTFPVDRFYDCGTVDRVLRRESRAAGRERVDARAPREPTVVPPCAIDPRAVIRDARIGPHVTVAAGARIVRVARARCDRASRRRGGGRRRGARDHRRAVADYRRGRSARLNIERSGRTRAIVRARS